MLSYLNNEVVFGVGHKRVLTIFNDYYIIEKNKDFDGKK